MTVANAHIVRAAARCLVVLAALALAGCAADGNGAGGGPLAGLGGGPAQAAADKPAEPAMTRQRAAEICWMKTEKGRADANLDQRADFVTKCIEQQMKSPKGTASASTDSDTPEPKPKPKPKPKT